MIHTGRHFLQIPGPTNVPDRILRAMDAPVIDHRSAEFASLGKEVLEGVREIFQTAGAVVMYPASGTGAWEAAVVNTLSPGDRVVLFETGHFSHLWRGVAEKFGIQVDYVPGNWRRGANAAELESRLAADRDHAIKAVMVVHNETSTGVTSRIPEIRRALDSARHPALLLVDTISSLASIDYRHDEWGVDVTIAGSQKGLMLPPGMSFNALSEKALRAAENARLPRSYWDWQESGTTDWTTLAAPLAPLTSVTPNSGYPELKSGNKDDLVLWMQEHLATAVPTQEITGVFGAETLANVESFQTAHGIAASGVVEAATWTALLALAPVAVVWTGSGPSD